MTVSDRAALLEVVGDAGLLVGPFRADAISEALARVLADSVLREEQRRRSLARAERFPGDRSIRQVLALVWSVANG